MFTLFMYTTKDKCNSTLCPRACVHGRVSLGEKPKDWCSLIWDPEEHVYTQVKRKDHTKTAKQERQYQRKGWAKNTSNSPLVN